MSSFGTSNYDITFDRINVELIPYVRPLIGIDFEHRMIIWGDSRGESEIDFAASSAFRYQTQIWCGFQCSSDFFWVKSIGVFPEDLL